MLWSFHILGRLEIAVSTLTSVSFISYSDHLSSICVLLRRLHYLYVISPELNRGKRVVFPLYRPSYHVSCIYLSYQLLFTLSYYIKINIFLQWTYASLRTNPTTLLGDLTPRIRNSGARPTLTVALYVPCRHMLWFSCYLTGIWI
jgi:hypothetical protein